MLVLGAVVTERMRSSRFVWLRKKAEIELS
jgi:hypothetical protein